jgi:glyoxylase-like metal-dependent hydrolase (beta-lactamase superfamily II)
MPAWRAFLPAHVAVFFSITNFTMRLFHVLILFLSLNIAAWADSTPGSPLTTLKVADNVYALIGSTQNRTYENHALNNNLGFVVTGSGVALIDSGASRQGAALIEAAVRKVTDLPIRWVFNLGVQDHRWLGNAYFADKGAHIIALQRTVDGQKRYADDHVALLKNILKDRFEGTVPLTAPAPIAADFAEFELGGTTFQLRWLGDAHYRGDAVLLLPQSGVLFAGDIVFHDRMLGVWPYSPVDAWRDTFRAMEKLPARVVVPGHGNPGDLAKARRDTGDYLDFLMDQVAPAARNWEPLDAVIARLADQPRFKHLEHYDGWHRRNINQTYLQFEGK